MNHKDNTQFSVLSTHKTKIVIGSLIGIGALVVMGVVGTVVDWRNWKKLELQYYGQGWKDLTLEALVLDKQVTDSKLGIRYQTSSDIRFTKFDLSISEGNESEIGVTKQNIEEPGGRAFVVQKMGKKVEDKVIVMEVKLGEEDWGKWEKTVQSVFESIKPL